MDPATKKYFRVSALAVLLCILLAGCSDRTPSSTPGSTGTKTVYIPHGEVEWIYPYSSDEALAEEVEEEGFLILKETVELTAEGRAEQIVTEAAIWADALYNTASGIGGRNTDSLQAETALQAMENGLFAPVSNTIEIFADNSDIISVTFTYQYSYEEEAAELDTALTDANGESETAADTAQAILDKVTVKSSNNGRTVSMTYTRQPDGTMAAQSSGSNAKSQVEQILEFASSFSESLGETISGDETTELVAEMGKNALQDVQTLVQEEGYTFESLPEQTDLYEAGTQHIKALDHSWEIYRYVTNDEIYMREFNRQPDTNGVCFLADMYDSIVDSTKKTATNTFTIQRAIGAEYSGKVAAVYITYEYGVTEKNRTLYTIKAVGIDGVPADQVDALLYANSFADLLALYRSYDGVTLGYDVFVIQSNTFGRYNNSKAWDGGTSSSSADEEAGISAADEWNEDNDEADDLDDGMGVDTGTAYGERDEDDDLDAMMGVDADPAAAQSSGNTDTQKSTTTSTATGEAAYYYPYASTYEGNVAIMDRIWGVLLGKSKPSDSEIGRYAMQAIDAAYASLDVAEARAKEVFEGA